MSRPASTNKTSGIVMGKRLPKDEPMPTGENREPNRSIKTNLPHMLSLYRIEKFDLMKKLEAKGINPAGMTFNEMVEKLKNLED
jgi:hypothetical protein